MIGLLSLAKKNQASLGNRIACMDHPLGEKIRSAFVLFLASKS